MQIKCTFSLPCKKEIVDTNTIIWLTHRHTRHLTGSDGRDTILTQKLRVFHDLLVIAENSTSKAVRPRWKPTTQQKETLERIYKNGMLSPTREDRERITAVLKHYGSVEEKNVLYWFRNKNAKEREKRKRALESSRSITQQEGMFLLFVWALQSQNFIVSFFFLLILL